jgi:glycosyltransferase involved in cell wall biosynthesis
VSPSPAPCSGLGLDMPDEARGRRADGTSTTAGRASVSLVIPAKNEAANLPWVLSRIPSFVDEVLIVDGLSTDGTIEVAQQLRSDIVVVHEMQPGKGAAVRAGFAAARGDVVVMLDADGSMDPAEIGRFVQAIEDGADLAKGSRRVDGGGSADLTAIRDLGNRGLLRTANLLFGTDFSELCYGYMAVRRSRIAELGLLSHGFEIETEIVTRAVRCGLAIVEVPSFEAPRRAGASNLSAIRDGLRIVRTLAQVRLGGIRRDPVGDQVTGAISES